MEMPVLRLFAAISLPFQATPSSFLCAFCASLRLFAAISLPFPGYPILRATRSELALIVTVPLPLLLLA